MRPHVAVQASKMLGRPCSAELMPTRLKRNSTCGSSAQVAHELEARNIMLSELTRRTERERGRESATFVIAGKTHWTLHVRALSTSAGKIVQRMHVISDR